jgi:hypothetical protein
MQGQASKLNECYDAGAVPNLDASVQKRIELKKLIINKKE